MTAMTTFHERPADSLEHGRPRPLTSLTRARGLLGDTTRVRVLMLWGGAVLLPMGLLTIVLGWYGTANTPYQYDQISYVVSGGLLGLGLAFVGGVLFLGAWLAHFAEQARESSDRVADALLVLAAAQTGSRQLDAATDDVRLVTAGKGTTLHRAECGLVRQRPDLVPAPHDLSLLSPCRVCRPLDPTSG